MIDDLKEIKKRYGENFSHLCRDNFAIILNEPRVLLQILEKNFAPTRSLYETIVRNGNLIYDFKDYIFEKYDEIRNQQSREIKEVTETPYELLDKAGYKLIECETEEEIQSFKKYYQDNEVICTIYNGGRLNRCYVFFAVKKNVQDIKRENFKKPQREDLYSTSVLSIQFPKHGTCVPDIISRYNHTVRDPNGTYGCDLNKIASGLEESFRKLFQARGIELNATNKESLYLPGYIKASDGKYYKYNIEVNGIFYCENNVIIDHGNIIKLELEKYLIIDYFIIDLVKKEIKLYDKTLYDSFTNGLTNIKNIKIDKHNEGKNIIISKDNYEDIIINIDKDNQIIYYKNINLKLIEDCFLQHNKKLKKIDIPNVKEIGIRFLKYNILLEELELPNVKFIGYDFLYNNMLLHKINLPKVETIGDSFLAHNEGIESISLPEVLKIGEEFLFINKKLNEIYLPKVKIIRKNFLVYNKSLKKLELPKIESIYDNFLNCNEELNTLNIKNVKYIGHDCLVNNKKIQKLELPNVETIGSMFMFKNEILNNLSIPKLRIINYDFLECNTEMERLELPEVEIINTGFLSENTKLKYLYAPKVHTIRDYFLTNNRKMVTLDLPNVKLIGNSFMYRNKILKTINLPIESSMYKDIENLHIRNLLIQQEKERLIELKEKIENNNKSK